MRWLLLVNFLNAIQCLSEETVQPSVSEYGERKLKSVLSITNPRRWRISDSTTLQKEQPRNVYYVTLWSSINWNRDLGFHVCHLQVKKEFSKCSAAGIKGWGLFEAQLCFFMLFTGDISWHLETKLYFKKWKLMHHPLPRVIFSILTFFSIISFLVYWCKDIQ